jgi:ankyrin repeat protein
MSDLFLAVIAGNLRAVKKLVNKDNVNVYNDNFNTPLMLSIYHDHDDISHYLIEFGANLDIMGVEGVNALYFAVIRGNVNITRKLLKFGADPNRYDYSNGHTILMKFFNKHIHNSYIGPLKEIISYKTTDLGLISSNRYQQSIFYMLLSHKYIETNAKRDLIKLLISLNIDFKHEDTLHFLVRSRVYDIDIIKDLIKTGVKVQNVVMELINAKKCKDDVIEIIRFLVNSGLNLNPYRNSITMIMTILMEAMVKQVDVDVIIELINSGADVNARDWDKLNCFMYSIYHYESFKLMKYLLNLKCINLEDKDRYGNTVLMRACEGQMIKTMKFLVYHGADINTTNNSEQTLIDKAEWTGNKKVIKYVRSIYDIMKLRYFRIINHRLRKSDKIYLNEDMLRNICKFLG